MIEIELPDGTIAEFPEGTSQDVIKSALQKRFAKTETGFVDQTMSGLNEGLAQAAGLPVDAMTGLLNVGVKGINAFVPTPEKRLSEIQNPVGGSGTMLSIMDPFISDVAPQTTAQRYGRRVGQEVGFGAPIAMATAGMGNVAGQAARASLPAFLTTSTASDVGAGLAGQAAQDIAPNSPTAQIAASLLGALAGGSAANFATPKFSSAPSLNDIKAAENAKWESVAKSDARLTPDAEAEYIARLESQLVRDRADNLSLFPRANATVADIRQNPNRTLYGIVEDRRLAGRNVAADANEASIGVGMKNEIDDYLRSLDETKVTGSDPRGAVSDYMQAKDLTGRRKRTEEIVNAMMKGERRAATSGTGGNEINTIRQNIGAILDRERDLVRKGKRAGYTPDEIKAMEELVMGTPTTNAARLLGRMSPTSGALPLAATGWGGAAGLSGAVATGNPLMAIPAIAGGAGMAGQAIGESLTRKQLDNLIQTILNGGARQQSAQRGASNIGRIVGALSSPQ